MEVFIAYSMRNDPHRTRINAMTGRVMPNPD